MHTPNTNATKNLLTISQASKYLGVSNDTLRRWEKKKILKPFRSPTGWRYFDKKQLDYVFVSRPELGFNRPSLFPGSPRRPSAPLPAQSPGESLHIKSITKSQPLPQTLSFVLVFFVSLDIILIVFYLLAIYLPKR